MTTLLSKVTTGRQRQPLRLLIWGVAGVGKTSLAAKAAAPLFLPVEEGCGHVDVARLPQPQTWGELMTSVRAVADEPHEYRTLIIDTLTAAEGMCWRAVCEAAKVKTIEDVGKGYGKGYIAAVEKWREMLNALEDLQRRRQMNVILIGHGTKKRVSNPSGPDYEAWIIALQERAAGLISGWCSDVLFAQWETFADGEERGGKLISTGNRILRTQEDGPWQAKNRHNLPTKLPLDWAVLVKHMVASATDAKI